MREELRLHRRAAPVRSAPMDLPPKDYASYTADLEAYEGYAYDGQVVDGVRHEVFGIADR
jgi:hypothetical protein